MPRKNSCILGPRGLDRILQSKCESSTHDELNGFYLFCKRVRQEMQMKFSLLNRHDCYERGEEEALAWPLICSTLTGRWICDGELEWRVGDEGLCSFMYQPFLAIM